MSYVLRFIVNFFSHENHIFWRLYQSDWLASQSAVTGLTWEVLMYIYNMTGYYTQTSTLTLPASAAKKCYSYSTTGVKGVEFNIMLDLQSDLPIDNEFDCFGRYVIQIFGMRMNA